MVKDNQPEEEEGSVVWSPKPTATGKEIAVMGGGCFSDLEAIFKCLKGVKTVTPGYAGGSNIQLEGGEAEANLAGHAEVVKVEFDPTVISYEELLKVFFSFHNPASHNKRDDEIGKSYRSIILYSSETQKKSAEKMIHGLEKEKVFDFKIVTEVKPLVGFFPALEHYQNFYEKNKKKLYCQLVINPKIKKLKQEFTPYLRANLSK